MTAHGNVNDLLISVEAEIVAAVHESADNPIIGPLRTAHIALLDAYNILDEQQVKR